MLEALVKRFDEEDLLIKQLIALAAGHLAGNLLLIIYRNHLSLSLSLPLSLFL
jgi:hypothetical protein